MTVSKIVIVDDEVIIARELEARLTALGYDVAGIAATGPEAIALTLEARPDLVLMDIMLKGGMDGIQATEEIRRHCSVPVIYLTAFADQKTLERAKVTGPHGYIVKPFTEPELRANVEMALFKHKAEEEVRRLNADLERRVRERTQELEAANKEMEAFAYSVSHDLRAPLRAIDGFSQALLEDYRDKVDAEGQDYLRRVRAASQRMAKLIDDLLHLSRLSRAPMNRQSVDLSVLAERVVSELRTVEPFRGVEVLIAPGVMAEGDPGLLEVVLKNLLSNAWKFTGKTSHARIEFGVTDHDGRPAFFVRDNGAGFDMAYADRLFGAFQRLHSEDEFPGTGIGLATVQRIIRRHGGRVWAEGAVGKGATFYFVL